MACPPYAPPAGTALSVILRPSYVAPVGGAIAVVLDPCEATPEPTGIPLHKDIVARFGRTTRSDCKPVDSTWVRLPKRERAVGAGWSAAGRRDDQFAARWSPTPRVDQVSGSGWSWSPQRDLVAQAAWSKLATRDLQRGIAWQRTSSRFDPSTVASWHRVYARDVEHAMQWDRARLPGYLVQPEGGQPYTPPAGLAIAAVLPGAYAPPTQGAINAALVGNAAGPPYVAFRSDPRPVHVPWGRVPLRDHVNVQPWGAGRYGGRDPIIGIPWVEPPPAPLPSLPILKVYVAMNTVTVVRLPDLTPIEVTSLDLSSGIDAWCWSLRMELADPENAALLTPDGNGPRSVRITINGYQWTALIEGRERSRAFAGERISVVGRSRTALLDAPYAPRRSGTQPDPRTARQLAEAELANTDFQLEWAGADWLVPGGAWYWSDLTPAEVLAEIATACGGVLQSLPGSDTFDVRPRYPVKPWQWTGVNADIALPASWVSDDATRYASKPLYDAVIVRGEQQGVQARVTRQGSGGEVWAPQVVHRLITHADAATQRAVAVLGDRGDIEVQDLRISTLR